MAAAIVAVLAVPWLAAIFDLDFPPGGTWVLIVVRRGRGGAVALHFVPVTATGGDVPPPAPIRWVRAGTTWWPGFG